MASVAQLKGRIKSVNSTKQITGAMQLVAASKMRRASERSLATKPYHRHISNLLMHLRNEGLEKNHPLMVQRPVKTRLLIVITSDTGLAGAYNSNVLKRYLKELEFDRKHGVKTLTITVGRKATNLATRLGEELVGVYSSTSNDEAVSERSAIIDTVITKYHNEEIDAVDIIYTEFYSSIKQEVKLWNFLPAGYTAGDTIQDTKADETYIFEPDKASVFSALVKRSLEIQLAQTVFDAAASEHSTRMMAMKNATDNANELSEDLTLAMNKERQAAITNELSDISNGANAVE